MPTEFEQGLANIQRRRAIAEAMQAQSMSPLSAPLSGTGGYPIQTKISPLQVISQLGQAFIARKQNQKLDAQMAEIAKAMSGAKSKALQDLMIPQDMAPATSSDEGPTHAPVPRRPSPQQIQAALDAGVDPEVIKSTQGFSGTLKPEEKAFQNGEVVAQGGPGNDLTYEQRLGIAAAGRSPGTQVSVNTEKSLYGTMAESIGKQNADLWQQAQKAPDLIERAQRVKKAIDESKAITGLGAEQGLVLAKMAAQLGFNTGDAAADTEALARDLAASTLEGIKSSGLGAGSGFSNADRDFLEKVVGGSIKLERKTLSRLADLNERAALKSMERWNATASRLDKTQLGSMGAGPIQMPGNTQPAAQPKLTKNPDGSFTYNP